MINTPLEEHKLNIISEIKKIKRFYYIESVLSVLEDNMYSIIYHDKLKFTEATYKITIESNDKSELQYDLIYHGTVDIIRQLAETTIRLTLNSWNRLKSIEHDQRDKDHSLEYSSRKQGR